MFPQICESRGCNRETVTTRLESSNGKMDVKSAYRIVPMHPGDHHLLAMQWNNQTYFVEAALLFGPRSAPKIFKALADAVEWMARKHGVIDVWHYLDDFIVCAWPSGPPPLVDPIYACCWTCVSIWEGPTRREVEGGRPFYVYYLLGNRNGHIG